MPATGMVNPNAVMENVAPYNVQRWRDSLPVATSYTLTGPTSGTSGVASTAFTVALPANQGLDIPAVVTPADAGTGTAGVFTPTFVRLTSTARSATFTYTPGSTGAKVISVTNVTDGSNGLIANTLTNPANITYTSS